MLLEVIILILSLDKRSWCDLLDSGLINARLIVSLESMSMLYKEVFLEFIEFYT